MMHTAELLQAFAAHRGDAIVVPGRGGRPWVKLSTHETLDVQLGDPAMGVHAGRLRRRYPDEPWHARHDR